MAGMENKYREGITKLVHRQMERLDAVDRKLKLRSVGKTNKLICALSEMQRTDES